MPRPSRRSAARLLGLALLATAVVAGVASGCSSDEKEALRTTQIGMTPDETGMPSDPRPVRGGQLVYGLEAETDSYCLPEAQLATGGLVVLRALYDPLTVPNGRGGYSPYLAKSVTPSADYKTWTITLRPNITFHDGTALTAEVVKNNLDAYRGVKGGHARSPLLFTFVYQDIDTVSVVNQLTVKVTTKVPWVAFDAALYSSGRVGIVAQAQLDADPETCRTTPIGTGPFEFVSWEENESLKVARNPDYWQKDESGTTLPYLNAIDFRPQPNSDQRLSNLLQGEINMMHTSNPPDIGANLLALAEEGQVNMFATTNQTEIQYQMLNASKPPFDQHDARIAAAQSLDLAEINERVNGSFAEPADSAFAPGVPGHLDDTGYPEYDLAAAKAAVAKMKAAGRSVKFRIVTDSDPSTIRNVVVIKQMLQKAGWEPELQAGTQPQLIDRAIAGDYEMAVFRNQPGDDADSDYLWWYGKSQGGGANPVNFNKFDDPVINENLDRGRTNPDPEARRKAYEEVNRQFGREAYNLWLWYAPWAVAEAPNVHGILGPTLPDGAPPAKRIVTGHPLLGIWIDSAGTSGQ
jgi:peptide/nickel transport system substrate-binding protein